MEYLTLLHCTSKLEIALKDKRDIVHFLECQNFILRELHDEVLDPKSTLSKTEKVGQLVEKIKDKILLDSNNYHLFVRELKINLRSFGEIVKIMDSEFMRICTGQKSSFQKGK